MQQPQLDHEFAEKMRIAAMTYQRDNATQFTRDRSKSVGASEAFNCPRALYITKQDIAKQNANPNDEAPLMENGGFMMRGKVMEDAYVAPLLKFLFGDAISHVGDDQETLLSPDTPNLTATPDGILTEPDGSKSLIEIKTIDPRASLTQPKLNHVLQTHVQMGVTGIKTYTRLMYVDASDYFNFTVFKIPYDDAVYKAAVVNADIVMNAHDGLDIDTTAAMMKNECASCKYNADERCGLK